MYYIQLDAYALWKAFDMNYRIDNIDIHSCRLYIYIYIYTTYAQNKKMKRLMTCIFSPVAFPRVAKVKKIYIRCTVSYNKNNVSYGRAV